MADKQCEIYSVRPLLAKPVVARNDVLAILHNFHKMQAVDSVTRGHVLLCYHAELRYLACRAVEREHYWIGAELCRWTMRAAGTVGLQATVPGLCERALGLGHSTDWVRIRT